MNKYFSGSITPPQLVLLFYLALCICLSTGCSDEIDTSTAFVFVAFEDSGLITGPPDGDPVVSLAAGGLVSSAPTPYETADDITDIEQSQIVDDAILSSQYFTIVDLPFDGEAIAFQIPPDNSGNWQVIAIGIRIQITSLPELEASPDASIWYGFTPQFVNGLVKNGDVIAVSLGPACNVTFPPDTPGDGIAPCL